MKYPALNTTTSYLFSGDCLDVLGSLDEGSIDMVLADPPYGTTRCKWDTVLPLPVMWDLLKRVIKPNGAIVMTAAQPFASRLVMSNPGMFRYDWIWEKGNATGHLNAKKMPMRAHEHVLVFYSSTPCYNPQKTTGHPRKQTFRRKGTDSPCYNASEDPTYYDSTERYPRSVQYFSSDKQKERKLHPTQKPIALMEYLIRTYTNTGDSVLDFVMGSGTTGVACRNLGRGFYGIEKDPDMFKTARDRIRGGSK
jgi:site-specific DNA-methyltransferase (adenine-specific)